jgi:cell division GTPase FtsZ
MAASLDVEALKQYVDMMMTFSDDFLLDEQASNTFHTDEYRYAVQVVLDRRRQTLRRHH